MEINSNFAPSFNLILFTFITTSAHTFINSTNALANEGTVSKRLVERVLCTNANRMASLPILCSEFVLSWFLSVMIVVEPLLR